MIPGRFIIMICCLFMCLFLTGCIDLKKKPIRKNYYDLTLKSPSPNASDTCTGATLLIKELGIATAFDSHSFIYRVGDDEYINDYYHEFISYPARLVTEKLTRYLCSTQHFTISGTSHKKPADYRLSGKILRIYGDFREKTSPKAVLEIQMRLEKRGQLKYAVALDKSFHADIALDSTRPEDLIAGWNKAMEQIVQQFMDAAGTVD